MHDYDNYHDALTDYSYAQYKKGAEEAGFTEKAAELRQFFPRNRLGKRIEGAKEGVTKVKSLNV